VLSLKARENEGLCGHCLKLADFSIEHGHPQIGKWAAAIEKERKEKKRTGFCSHPRRRPAQLPTSVGRSQVAATTATAECSIFF
jgi:hypothetical protein